MYFLTVPSLLNPAPLNCEFDLFIWKA